MSTSDTVDGLEAMVRWCVPGFVEAAARRRLPGTYKSERFWHGKSTVDRYEFWTVAVPCMNTDSGLAMVRVYFDGHWDWLVRPADAQMLPIGLEAVQAAFDATLAGPV
jgi:hypothetical protein